MPGLRLFAFYMAALALGVFLPQLPWWANVALSVVAGLSVTHYWRPIALWISRDLSCPDPYCMRCRMRNVDLRRAELEILEQIRVMSQEHGESTH
jgi:hypothetical protein